MPFWSHFFEPQPFGCGSKNRYQNGTLVSGHMDQNPRTQPQPCAARDHFSLAFLWTREWFPVSGHPRHLRAQRGRVSALRLHRGPHARVEPEARPTERGRCVCVRSLWVWVKAKPGIGQHMFVVVSISQNNPFWEPSIDPQPGGYNPECETAEFLAPRPSWHQQR